MGVTEIKKTEEKKMEEMKTGEVKVEPVRSKDLELSKEYSFEGARYSSLDLSRLEDLTGSDMVEINRIMTRRGSIESSPELSMEYAFHMAARALGMPVEFFYQLSPRDCIKVKSRVQGFLLGLA